jgi:agmatinase
MIVSPPFIAAFFALASATNPNPNKLSAEELWSQDWPFAGIQTFAHLPHTKCLTNPSTDFDIGIIGVPFDTTVSFRPGARFGPAAIRAASQRQTSLRGYNFRSGLNPYLNWANVLDCGDMSVTPIDNVMALKQMTVGFDMLTSHPVSNDGSSTTDILAQEINDDIEITANKTRDVFPRLITLGGDHSIILPALRALHKKYGPVTLIHFDAHLDTWDPTKYPSAHWYENDVDGEDSHGHGHDHGNHFTHGSMLWMASQEGLLHEDSNFHIGLRTKLSGYEDYIKDDSQGFHRVHADDILYYGIEGIANQILNTIPEDSPVYISIDIDVLDPSAAPGTGTPEVGGFLSRELIQLIRKLENLKIVGADIVEVSPGYDHAEITALAAAQVAYELVSSMVKVGPLRIVGEGKVEAVKEVVVDVEENVKPSDDLINRGGPRDDLRGYVRKDELEELSKQKKSSLW